MSCVKIFHLIAFSHYLCLCVFCVNYLEFPDHEGFDIFRTNGGLFKFATTINLCVQGVFFFVCVLNDIFGTNELKPKRQSNIRSFRDFLQQYAFSCSMFITTTFWGLYHVDRDIIFPAILSTIIPPLFNHAIHTNIAVFSILEQYLCYHEYPKKLSYGTCGAFSIALIYMIGIGYLRIEMGCWPYPVMNMLPTPLLILLFSSALATNSVLYYCGYILRDLIWSSKLQAIESNQQKKVK